MNIPSLRRLIGTIGVTGVLIATPACGGSDDPAAPVEAPTAETPAPVEVTAVDFAFQGLPDTVPAGTVFALANDADTELHEFVAIRLPDDETRPVAEIVANPDDLVALFPNVATVLLAPPGEAPIAAVGDGTLTEPGRYAIICAIPTGADPAEYLAAAAESEGGPPEVAGGPPHFVHGMFGEIVVEG